MENNCLPIKPEDLNDFIMKAVELLRQIKWTPKKEVFGSAKKEPSTYAFRESSIGVAPSEEIVSILKIAHQLSGNPALLSEDIHRSLVSLQKGLSLGMYFSRNYSKFSGLDHLLGQNQKSTLTITQQTEFREKHRTCSAITLFVVAYYVSFELGKYKTEEVSNIKLDFAGIPELSMNGPVQAMSCLLYYYGAYLEKSGVVCNGLDFVKMTQLYFKGVINEIKMQIDSLKYLESFVQNNYKLTDGDFCVNGFEVEFDSGVSSIEFNRVEMQSIVGNRDAKHKAKRLAERLICFDPVVKRNPMYDLGFFPAISMGYGKPGTGKSLIIAATATMLGDYCKELGIPFLFWPMPDTVVSTFQGGSAERMVSWMKPLQDPSKIIYAPIDDAENNFEDRSRQGVSAGVREVISVFLRYTEGASAKNHGNWAIGLFTNLPEQLDPAVLSRIVDRFAINGAESIEDFLDQDCLWWTEHKKMDSNFIKMKDPSDYKYFSQQIAVKSLSTVYGSVLQPSSSNIAEIFKEVERDHDISEQKFFANIFYRVWKTFPRFSSRDIRNIQKAINTRISDFDFPEEWLSNPELFFKQDYDRKKNMIMELVKANMKGLSFAEIRKQEVITYLDNFIKIVDMGKERKINEIIENHSLQLEAMKRLQPLKN